MRIIAGKHKNRIIPTSKKSDYRPSTTKFREAVFSILSSGEFSSSTPIIGAKILDLFAGTGALSFESISRGANSATLVDRNSEHLKSAMDFAIHVGEGENISTLLMDALNLPKMIDKYDIVFIDPPYYNKYVEKAVKGLEGAECLKQGALIVIEMEKREELKISDYFEIAKEKIYGNNKLLILRYNYNCA